MPIIFIFSPSLSYCFVILFVSLILGNSVNLLWILVRLVLGVIVGYFLFMVVYKGNIVPQVGRKRDWIIIEVYELDMEITLS